MKSFVHNIVRTLLELQTLEERLQLFRRNNKRLAEVQAHIESVRKGMPAQILATHDRFQAQGKRCIAELRRDVCSGCHLGLATGNVAALKRGDLRRCGNCGRYLYVVDEEPSDQKTQVRVRRKASATLLKTSTISPIHSYNHART